jgi:hypothetical protein
VIPDGVDAALFGAAEATDADAARDTALRARPRAGLRLNVTNGLAQGLDLLLAAWRRSTPLVLAGRGSDRAAVRAAVARAGLRDGAVLLLRRARRAPSCAPYRGAAVVGRVAARRLPRPPALGRWPPGCRWSRPGPARCPSGGAPAYFPVDSVACLRRALYRFMPGSDLVGREELVRRGLARAREYTWAHGAGDGAAYERALRSHT